MCSNVETRPAMTSASSSRCAKLSASNSAVVTAGVMPSASFTSAACKANLFEIVVRSSMFQQKRLGCTRRNEWRAAVADGIGLPVVRFS